MTLFTHDMDVHFQHCDAAGIVFYPRYFEMISEAIEEWFKQEIGVDYFDLHIKRKNAIPMAHMELDFLKPSYLNETLTFAIGVREIRNSTFRIALTISGQDEDRVRAEFRLAFVDAVGIKTTRIPDDIRSQMERFLIAPETSPAEELAS